MRRQLVARVAFVAAVLLIGAAAVGIAWASQYPYHDITETYVQMLSIVGLVSATAAFGVYWHFRR